jgi:hypothetical protein
LGCTPHVSLNSSALHFGSLKFDNTKGPYYSLLAKEAVIFRFEQINSLLTVEVVLLNWSSGLASRVQLSVTSVTAVTRT